jgi:hypothetical protein
LGYLNPWSLNLKPFLWAIGREFSAKPLLQRNERLDVVGNIASPAHAGHGAHGRRSAASDKVPGENFLVGQKIVNPLCNPLSRKEKKDHSGPNH